MKWMAESFSLIQQNALHRMKCMFQWCLQEGKIGGRKWSKGLVLVSCSRTCCCTHVNDSKFTFSSSPTHFICSPRK
jgi:hypothetical protein